ncbi:MAG: hypothetical protein WDZ35_13120 [Crocinitomicaceae bacterium]
MTKSFLFCILIFFAFPSFGQYDLEDAKEKEEKDEDEKLNFFELKKRIYVGADLSLRFGNSTYLYIGPMVGYDIWKGVSAGVTSMYQFSRFSFTGGSAISYHSYGAGLFARYRPLRLPNLLLQAEFDVYNTDDFTTAYGGDRTFVPAVMPGLGYAGGTDRFYYQLMLFYDLVNDPNNPLPRLFSDFPLYIRYGIVFYLG